MSDAAIPSSPPQLTAPDPVAFMVGSEMWDAATPLSPPDPASPQLRGQEETSAGESAPPTPPQLTVPDPVAFMVGSEMWDSATPLLPPDLASPQLRGPEETSAGESASPTPPLPPADDTTDGFAVLSLADADEVDCTDDTCCLLSDMDLRTPQAATSNAVASLFALFCDTANLSELSFEQALHLNGIDFYVHPRAVVEAMKLDFRRKKNRLFAKHSRQKKEKQMAELEARQRVLQLEIKVLEVQLRGMEEENARLRRLLGGN